ncbi:sigma-54-dependent transcriptional regulator [Marinomonas transparens]|uniref:Sigma-54-dependent Fis family transcriptional regulator n=1 Tax=Marinomonas transparens TaxID=2795388 RepID=A0A934JTD6_9GAMM|nr:sigma-54 dependent transcriptional regulator [Marinomonas transparens]MBJ7537977.1 sigma-54-dependent Fis family transcriptional regulator [Marinomonas transparens]
MHHIMIICPEDSPLKESEKWLSRYGFQVNICSTLEQANKYYDLPDFHLILVDQKILDELQTNDTPFPDTPPRIVLDSRPSLSTGVDAMAHGAVYYLPLPTDSENLLKHVVNVLEKANDAPPSTTVNKPTSQILFARTEKEEEALHLGDLDSNIIGHCPPMQSLFSDIRKVAGTDVTVLIRGESGTGKELVAKALHSLSKRHKHPIISVNCAAIPENLIESELFGHEKGAFTGAVSARDGLIYAADKGTLFLDEIGELPLEAQARLLRVLQEGEIRRVGAVQSSKVDIRLVTATHRNLIQMVKQGRFREDLYYRLYVMELLLPPLRDRGDDISILAKALLEKTCLKHKRPICEYNKEFNKAIRDHHWPGNVRELENAIERAVILSPTHKVEAANLKIAAQIQNDSSSTKDAKPTMNTSTQEGTTLDDYFKYFVTTHQHTMTETQLAHSLGISRKSLWERRQKLEIPKKVTNNK